MTLDLAMDLQLARIKQRLSSAYHEPVTVRKRVVSIREYRAHDVRERLCPCGKLKGDPRAEMCRNCRVSAGWNHGFGRFA